MKMEFKTMPIADCAFDVTSCQQLVLFLRWSFKVMQLQLMCNAWDATT